MSGEIVLACRPRPLQLEREVRTLPAGRNVHQLVEAAIADPRLRQHAVVQVDGDIVVYEAWDLVPPPGAMVAVTVVPEGGQDALRIVLSIAVVAIATYATAGLATGPLAGTMFAGAVGQAVIGATITAAGLLAVNALVPPAQPEADDTEAVASYGIAGTRNALRPWQPVPLILGRVRYTPPLAAQQVVEPRGDAQVLSALFCWGYGPLQLDDLAIGETSLGAYQEVEVESVPGTPGEVPTLSIYPQSIGVETVAVQLTDNGGWAVRTTAPMTDKAVVEIQFPRGLIGYGKKTGDKLDQEVTIGVRFRAVGDTDWTDAGDLETRGTTTSVVRAVRWITFGTRGQYEVGVRRETPDAEDDRHISESWWVTLRSVTNANPVNLPGVALTALRIRASEQLSGGIDELRATVTSICPDWDADLGEWIERPTNNPASLFRWVLQHPSRRRPTPDSLLDLPGLQAWHAACVEYGLTCNLVLDRRAGLDEALRTIAACGRGIVRRPDGRWSVVMDAPRPYPVQLFTPRNSWGFRARRSFAPVPDAIRFRFVDETQGWVQDERLVYRDGVAPEDATEILDLEQPGVTHPDQAWLHARYRLAEIIHRPETWELSADFEHLVCERGDRIQVQHDVILSGVGAGRVRELVTDGAGDVTAIRIDETLALEADLYILRGRRSDLSTVELRLGDLNLVTDTLPLETPTAVAGCPAVGDLVAVYRGDTLLEDALVLGIRPGAELSAQLTLVPYREAVYDAPWAEIPAWEPRITPAFGTAPIITAIRSDRSVLDRDAAGTVRVQAVVTLFDDGRRPLSRLQGVELRWEIVDTAGEPQLLSAPADATEIRLTGLEVDTVIRVAARWRFTDGRAGPWSGTQDHLVVGPALPPPDVTLLWATGDAVEWEYRFPPKDLAGFRIRFSETAGTDWSEAIPLTDAPVTTQRLDLAELPPSVVEVLVRAESTAGLLSVNVGRVAVTVSDLVRRYRWAIADQRDIAWPGDRYGGELRDGQLEAPDTSLWLDPPGGLWLDPPDGLWLLGDYAPWAYQAQWTCPAEAAASDAVRVEAVGSGRRIVRWRWQPGPDEPAAPEDDLYGQVLNDDRQAPVYYDDDPELPFYRQVDELQIASMFGDILPEGSLELAFALGLPHLPVYDLLDPSLRSAWLPYRGAIRPRPGRTLEVRVYAAGGLPRSSLANLRLLLDSQERIQVLENHPLTGDAGSGVRLEMPAGWREVRWAHALLQQPTSATVVRKLQTSPPILAATDAAGLPVDARADITLGGY